MQDNYVWANLMNQLDVLLESPWPSWAYVLNFLLEVKNKLCNWLIPSHPQSSSGRIIFGRNLSAEAKKGKSHLVISLGPSFRPPSVLRSGSRGCQLPVSIWIILWWGKQRVHAGSIWGSDPGEKLFLVGFGVVGICENWWGGVKISWVPLPHVLSICFFSSSWLPAGLLAE